VVAECHGKGEDVNRVRPYEGYDRHPLEPVGHGKGRDDFRR
jgi:hypothetical protein